jgi:hypothetical protein
MIAILYNSMPNLTGIGIVQILEQVVVNRKFSNFFLIVEKPSFTTTPNGNADSRMWSTLWLKIIAAIIKCGLEES